MNSLSTSIFVCLALNLGPLIHAQDATESDAPRSPRQEMVQREIQDARAQLRSGKEDDLAVSRLEKFYKETRSVAQPSIAIAQEFAAAAREAVEQQRPIRAIKLANQSLRIIQDRLDEATQPLSLTEKGRLLEMAAYIYERVLRDPEAARAWMRIGLELNPNNSALRDRLKALSGPVPSSRVFGLQSPALNQGLAISPRPAALKAVIHQGGIWQIDLEVPEEGTYRIEFSSDLVSWNTLQEKQLARGQHKISVGDNQADLAFIKVELMQKPSEK